MDLILWRHAEAEDGMDDLARKLTKHGERQASRVASWLVSRLPDKIVILASPAVRTRQTASALGRHFDIESTLAPGRSPDDVLAAANWPSGSRSALIVGHQPTLGRVASRLLANCDDQWPVRKAAVWWFSSRDREEGANILLRAVISPDML